jgi:hypothetical protein
MALNFPDSPTLNQVYTDSTSGFSYQWDGVVWQSYTPSATKNILVLDDISGSFNSSTTIFNLTNSGTAVTPANSQQLRVTLGGIVQEPGTDYIVAASTIIFTTAPTLGLDCSIVSLGPAVASNAPPNSGTIFARQEYNPTGIQTTFTVTNNYSVGYLEVYHNGVKLVDGTDFTATDGSTFDLTTPAQNGDVIEAIVYLQTTLYTLGAYANDLTILGNATVAGVTTLGNTIVGGGTTQLVVNGNARVTGILTIGTSSVTIDGVNNQIKIGTGVTISSTGITGSASTVTSAAIAYGLIGTPNINVGFITATGASISGNVNVGGNVSIAGTLTYEDVTNVDSIGIVTARSGAHIATLSGNLLVATTSATGTASQPLQVNGGAYVSGSLGVGDTNPSGGNVAQLSLFGYNAVGVGYHQFLKVKNTYGSATNPVKHFRLNSTGGIEVVNDAYTVTIFTLDNSGNITASGNVTGYSDETLKDNVQTIPNALDKVIQLRGVEFDRNDIEGNPHQIGVIAQEVEKIIPEVVQANTDGIKSVAYGNLVGLLIEAIKDLKEEVNELKARLEEV